MFRIFAYLHRHPESGIFYFRLTVPPHLRDTLKRREIKKSTRTGIRSEAIFCSRQLYVETQKLFQHAEACMTRHTKKDVDAIPGGTLRKITFLVGGQKVIVEHDDPAKEAEIARKLLGSKPGSTQQAKKEQSSKKEVSLPLSKMIHNYFLEVKRTETQQPKTIEENAAIFQLLQEVLKNPAVSTIGFKSATEFKNILLRLPPNRTKGFYAGKSIAEIVRLRPNNTMSNASVNKYLRRTSALFEWGKRHGYVHENPFSGIGIRQQHAAHQLRDRYTVEELQKLFDPKHHKPDMRKSYQYWLPWLGLYTGARLEELCQLHLENIRQENEVWVIDINGRDGRRLKTPSSERLVPIHPQLVALGILNHAEGLRKRGEKRLFPELEQRRDGYGQTASKWFGRHREKLGIKKPFHSLRHTFIDELKQRDGDYKKIAALAGHTDETMTFGRYGKPFQPDALYPIVCLLDFDLPQ